jgi:hypothetical protein
MLSQVWSWEQSYPGLLDGLPLKIVSGERDHQEKLPITQYLSRPITEDISFLRDNEIEWQNAAAFWYREAPSLSTRWELPNPQIQTMDFYQRLGKREDL